MKDKILPNGATIIALDWAANIVLADTGDNYVTWSIGYAEGNERSLRATSNGHYFKRDLTEAREDYAERVKRGY